jgi:hypothetical protein
MLAEESIGCFFRGDLPPFYSPKVEAALSVSLRLPPPPKVEAIIMLSFQFRLYPALREGSLEWGREKTPRERIFLARGETIF